MTKLLTTIVIALAAVCLAACGSVMRTVSVERDATTVVQQAPASAHPATLVQTPATTTVVQPAPTTTLVQPAPQTTVAPAPVVSVSAGLSFRACDQNISASQDASCPLAENVFYELWEQNNGQTLADTTQTVSAYSPVSQSSFAFTCGADSETVTCVSNSDASDAVTFPLAALYDYTQADAAAYASSHVVG